VSLPKSSGIRRIALPFYGKRAATRSIDILPIVDRSALPGRERSKKAAAGRACIVDCGAVILPIPIACGTHPSGSFEAMKRLGLDATDIRILNALQQNGQLSKIKLSELANISASLLEWKGGLPILPRGVAKLLKPFRIRPARDRTGSFYRRGDFADAVERYASADLR
jgi:hypothetical protein